MKQYRVRKSVLNMTIDQWKTYKEITGDADIMVISANLAYEKFGYIGMLTAKINDEEREFGLLLHRKYIENC